MERLWAPWRLEYIKAAADTGAAEAQSCIFCRFPAEARDRENLIVDRAERSFAILNRFPYNNGHVMVVPHAHVADPALLLSSEDWGLVGEHLRFSLGVLREVYRADGYNVGMNLGRTAGAGIADHLHWHIVPRWNGDTNFMPVLGATKVISEHLDRTCEALAEAFALARRR